ncbi:MAG: glycosyl transferase [Ilumatobacteraceae bacterium]|nr:glycosyl transferase [Ilumatobacteraceae bacterium]
MPGSEYAITVPYYANPRYLRLTLDSVVAQTEAAWWCVVVDDSPDNSASAVVEAVGDQRITLERNPATLGLAGNFNRCVDVAVARGAELGMILHADDLLEPAYVATMRAAHLHNPAAACVAPKVKVIDAAGRPHRPLPDRVKAALWPSRLDRLEGEHGLRLLLRGQFFYCPAVSYRWALLERPAWDDRWRQVMDLMLYGRVILGGGCVQLEPAQVFRYRRHCASETQQNSATLSRTEEETAACNELASAAEAIGWRRARRAGLFRTTVRLQSMLQALLALGRGDLALAGRALRLTFRP